MVWGIHMDIFQNQGRKKLQPPDNLRWDFFSRLDSWESKNCFFFGSFDLQKHVFGSFDQVRFTRRGNMVSKNFDRYVNSMSWYAWGKVLPCQWWLKCDLWRNRIGDEISTATKCQCTRNLPHCRPSNACSSKLLQWFWNWETQLDNVIGWSKL